MLFSMLASGKKGTRMVQIGLAHSPASSPSTMAKAGKE